MLAGAGVITYSIYDISIGVNKKLASGRFYYFWMAILILSGGYLIYLSGFNILHIIFSYIMPPYFGAVQIQVLSTMLSHLTYLDPAGLPFFVPAVFGLVLSENKQLLGGKDYNDILNRLYQTPLQITYEELSRYT